jgi:fatty acid desaturase
VSIQSPRRQGAAPCPAKTTTRTRRSTGAPGAIRRELGRPLLDQLDALCRPPAWSAVLYPAGDYLAAAAAACAACISGNPAVAVIAIAYIGVRQRYLSNITHECAHRKLVRSRRLNELIGHLIAISLIQSCADYEDEHRTHHALLGRDGDPKLQSYAAKGATTPPRDKREFLLRVIAANAVWSLPKRTLTDWFTKRPKEPWATVAARAAAWAALLALATATGVVADVILYWLVPLLLVRPCLNWMTDLGNHAGLLENDDPVCQARGWSSNAWTRHILGGHLDDMYHPVHHWCPQIPFRVLPRACQLIRDQYPRAGEVAWCSGFFFRRRRTPEVPCVIDDIVMRLRHHQIQNPVS